MAKKNSLRNQLRSGEVQRRYLTTKEAATYLGRAEQTLVNWRWLKQGPPYHRVGPQGKVFYAREDLDAWLRQHRIIPRADN